MNRKARLTVLLVFSFCLLLGQHSVFINPVIPGFNPDPSVCRAGKDYYLVCSSNEYFPGLPVYHSRDLVNWKMIGHALDQPSQLNLDSVNCSGGIYAPTIRYHEGTFYIVCTLAGVPGGRQRGNFMLTAKNPAGPWSGPLWLTGLPGIDPSLFFDDDGRVFLHGNMTPSNPVWDKHRNIWMQEFDLKAGHSVGEARIVLDGAEYYGKGTLDGGIAGGMNNYESPHLYKKDHWYYLVIAHGGTFQNHAVSIWRSRSVFGPFESNPANPILTHRDLPVTSEITSTGHADLVQSPAGAWWMVFHGRRPYGGEYYILGREVFLAPVDWSRSWPVVNPFGDTGRAAFLIKVEGRKLPNKQNREFQDDFDEAKLRPEWTFLRTPRSDWWSLDARKGFLRFDVRPELISTLVNPSFIGYRQRDPDCSATVRMEFVPEEERQEAGLAVLRDRESYFKFTYGKFGGKNQLQVTQSVKDGSEKILATVEVAVSQLFMRVSASGTDYTFDYSRDGKKWNNLLAAADGRFLGAQGLGRFTGTLIALYATSNGNVCRNRVDFDWFRYQPGNTPAR